MTAPPTFNTLSAEHLTFFENLLGADRLSTRHADLELHARDQSFHPPRRPDVILLPQTTVEVSAILRYANANRLPVTAWGVGTSLEGNSIAVRGGIMLDFSRMAELLAVRLRISKPMCSPASRASS